MGSIFARLSLDIGLDLVGSMWGPFGVDVGSMLGSIYTFICISVRVRVYRHRYACAYVNIYEMHM